MVGIMDAWSDEFHKMGTFADDYYKNVITPYKEGVRGKPGFWQSMKNWQPWRSFMPQSMGGTFFTKPTSMASTALRGASRIPLAAFASDALAGTSLLSGGNREVRAGRDFERSEPSSAVNEYAAGRGAQPTFSRPSANRDFTQTDYGKSYQRGGSVNPFEETAQAARDWSPREQRFNDGPPSQMNPPSSDRLVNDYFTPSIDGGISNVSNVNDRSLFQAQVDDNPLTHFNPFRQFIRQASLNRLASKHGYQGDVDAAEEAIERANYGQTNNPLIPDVDWGNRNIEWNFPYGKGAFDIRFGPDSAYFGWGTS